MAHASTVDEMLLDIDDLDDNNDVSMTDRDLADEMEPYAYKNHTLDCYPYTFSPLLLFSTEGYFDRGYSNYNAVASFFEPVLKKVMEQVKASDVEDGNSRKSSRASPEKEQREGGGRIDMLEGVVYERKNMT
jgi:hypothetical protein